MTTYYYTYHPQNYPRLIPWNPLEHLMIVLATRADAESKEYSTYEVWLIHWRYVLFSIQVFACAFKKFHGLVHRSSTRQSRDWKHSEWSYATWAKCQIMMKHSLSILMTMRKLTETRRLHRQLVTSHTVQYLTALDFPTKFPVFQQFDVSSCHLAMTMTRKPLGECPPTQSLVLLSSE